MEGCEQTGSSTQRVIANDKELVDLKTVIAWKMTAENRPD
jgi:regulator of protease activity HflC (stomatin/prohibitin superfamily)